MTVVDPPLSSLMSRVVTVAGLAEMFVETRRVVPGLTIGADGVARSWWWPLPSASDRGLLAALLDGNDIEDHVRLADELGNEVDRKMRQRLVVDGVGLLEPRSGRRTVPDAWVRSLTALDPRLSGSLDTDRVVAFAAVVDEWVRSGVVGLGRARLCIRVHEPLDGESDDVWTVEAMAQDVDEPSLMIALRDVWGGSSPFGVEVLEELLSALGRMARIAPELSGLLDAAVPDRCEVGDVAIVELLQEHVGPLEDAGVVVLLPGWWTNRRLLGLRATTSRSAKSDSAVTAAGFGFDQIVEFAWKAALGDVALTAADLRALQGAADAKRSLVRVRGMWVELRPDEIAALLAGHGTKGEGTVGELVRIGLGIDALDAPNGAMVVGVDASGWLGTLLDDALHATVDPVPTPVGFDGELRPYQERGVGWLAFLGRVGLGACLADDMGLGKTAQVIALMLSDRVDGPTLVVCPTSVLGNWEREVN
ncbi:MAG: SNF2 helicase-associated domain-containing protein, partial [Ilumatobacteraceae bacterium]